MLSTSCSASSPTPGDAAPRATCTDSANTEAPDEAEDRQPAAQPPEGLSRRDIEPGDGGTHNTAMATEGQVELRIGWINAASRFRSSARLWSWLRELEGANLHFDAIFIPECDGVLAQRRNVRHAVPGWICWRSWPGPGAKPMMWLLRRKWASSVRSCRRWGRSFALVLQARASPLLETRLNETCLIGVHGQASEPLTSVAEALALRRRLGCRHWLLCGDWNIDWLPGMLGDWWSEDPRRQERHELERGQLADMIDSAAGSVRLPEFVDGADVLDAHAASMSAPYTRVPWAWLRAVGAASVEDTDESEPRASLLGYACSRMECDQCSATWWRAIADHALASCRVEACVRTWPRKSRVWHPRDVDTFEACVLSSVSPPLPAWLAISPSPCYGSV